MSSQSKKLGKGQGGSPDLPQISPKQIRKTLLYVLLAVAAVILFQYISPGDLWNLVIFRPMLNSLLFLYQIFGRNVVWSIVIFTVAVRLLTLPLTMKQLRSSRVMQELQPEMDALKKKYASNKDKLQQETMKLYQEKGVNPMGGCLPMLVQFPIWIGLYQSIIQLLSDDPLQLLKLAQNIYMNYPTLSQLLPLNSRFFWLDLGRPDPYYILPILVAGTMWAQQKMMTPPGGDSQQASMNQSMQLMMPLMFGYITLQYASGLALYFVVSNIVGIAIQFAIAGPGGLAGILPGSKVSARPASIAQGDGRGKEKDVAKKER